MEKVRALKTKLTGAWHIVIDGVRRDFYKDQISERPLSCDNVINMAVLKNINQFAAELETRRVAAAHSSAGHASSSQ